MSNEPDLREYHRLVSDHRRETWGEVLLTGIAFLLIVLVYLFWVKP